MWTAIALASPPVPIGPKPMALTASSRRCSMAAKIGSGVVGAEGGGWLFKGRKDGVGVGGAERAQHRLLGQPRRMVESAAYAHADHDGQARLRACAQHGIEDEPL